LPLRGKILNVKDANFVNEEIRNIFTALSYNTAED
jgi:DNA gyrase/topoisomerase IV subunit B